jgi:hypothetical protein
MPRVGGGEWCFQHDPTLANARQLARTLGGKRRKRLDPITADPTSLRTIEECICALEQLADDARRLHHGEGRIRALTSIIRTALDAHRDHTLEKRLDELEARLATNSTPQLRRA